ncbi:MAG: hypothetical protein NT108_03655, partial [Candidatus Kaiserbacteria bacterium]|nr:hypothetical protein [Candidatus Kaiserbacteria bacterium]
HKGKNSALLQSFLHFVIAERCFSSEKNRERGSRMLSGLRISGAIRLAIRDTKAALKVSTGVLAVPRMVTKHP